MLLLSLTLLAASQHVMIRTTDGVVLEGDVAVRAIAGTPIDRVLSVHSATPASEFEKGRIAAGIEAIQGAQ